MADPTVDDNTVPTPQAPQDDQEDVTPEVPIPPAPQMQEAAPPPEMPVPTPIRGMSADTINAQQENKDPKNMAEAGMRGAIRHTVQNKMNVFAQHMQETKAKAAYEKYLAMGANCSADVKREISRKDIKGMYGDDINPATGKPYTDEFIPPEKYFINPKTGEVDNIKYLNACLVGKNKYLQHYNRRMQDKKNSDFLEAAGDKDKIKELDRAAATALAVKMGANPKDYSVEKFISSIRTPQEKEAQGMEQDRIKAAADKERDLQAYRTQMLQKQDDILKARTAYSKASLALRAHAKKLSESGDESDEKTAKMLNDLLGKSTGVVNSAQKAYDDAKKKVDMATQAGDTPTPQDQQAEHEAYQHLKDVTGKQTDIQEKAMGMQKVKAGNEKDPAGLGF